MCTFACHALMVPTLLRRPRQGLQGPAYQLDAVELAVIWWSSIIPLSIPRGTEQPEHNVYIEGRLTSKNVLVIMDIFFWSMRSGKPLAFTWWHLTIKLTAVELHAECSFVVPFERVEPNESSNHRRKKSIFLHLVGVLVATEYLVMKKWWDNDPPIS